MSYWRDGVISVGILAKEIIEKRKSGEAVSTIVKKIIWPWG